MTRLAKSYRAALPSFVCALLLAAVASASDPLPSWNSGPAKQAIVDFVKRTTDPSSPSFVPAEQRIAAFDQDGTTWVEYPVYTELVFALDRVKELAPNHPDWRTTQPFQAVLSGDKQAMADFTVRDLETILITTHSGMTVDQFQQIVRDWIAQARDPRWKRPYPELVYQPMLEVMRYLRANGYRTYIVTGGGQDFVRAYSEKVYGIPPDQVIGSALKLQYAYDKTGKAVLEESPKLLLNDDRSGKAKDIHLFIGRHAKAAFGNSNGDREMLEYTETGGGSSLMMLVLHDDAQREYAYGPAQGLPDTKVGTFSQSLYEEARLKGWTVISMKRDWKCIFGFQRIPDGTPRKQDGQTPSSTRN